MSRGNRKPRILTLLHTVAVHADTFDRLRDRIAPGLALHHDIRKLWLRRAQAGPDATLAEEIRAAVARAPGPVICTCTTLGPLAEAAGAIRIDAPMMAAAARYPGQIVMAYCLDSTRAPSGDLLQRALDAAGNPARVHPLRLTGFWPLFEAGHEAAFAEAIAGAVKTAVAGRPGCGSVVLAQASMAGAAAHLTALPCPVLTSPDLAFRAALDRL